MATCDFAKCKRRACCQMCTEARGYVRLYCFLLKKKTSPLASVHIWQHALRFQLATSHVTVDSDQCPHALLVLFHTLLLRPSCSSIYSSCAHRALPYPYLYPVLSLCPFPLCTIFLQLNQPFQTLLSAPHSENCIVSRHSKPIDHKVQTT